MALAPTKVILYSTALSGCSARVRISSLLKGISLSEHTLDLNNDQSQHHSLNPNATVPTLLATYPNGQSITITQSLSMLAFIEDHFPSPVRLLPPITDMKARMRVRDLATLVACDIQPVQNSKVRQQLEKQGQSSTGWAKCMLRRGIGVFEALAVKSAGQFSVGDELSWADVCLYPMVQGALRLPWERDELLGVTPTVSKIMKSLENIDAFRAGGLQFNAQVQME